MRNNEVNKIKETVKISIESVPCLTCVTSDGCDKMEACIARHVLGLYKEPINGSNGDKLCTDNCCTCTKGIENCSWKSRNKNEAVLL